MDIVFFIDQQRFMTQDPEQSSAALLRLAGEDPAETTLVLKHGNELTKYADDEIVKLENGMHFVVFHDGPTPVSAFGPERFVQEITELGYSPQLTIGSDKNTYAILSDYEVLLGKFAGRRIDLGFLATADYPISVASAIHVRAEPQLYDTGDSLPGVRNITDSRLGPAWRYWSVNFNWEKGRNARRLMSKVNTVFRNA